MTEEAAAQSTVTSAPVPHSVSASLDADLSASRENLVSGLARVLAEPKGRLSDVPKQRLQGAWIVSFYNVVKNQAPWPLRRLTRQVKRYIQWAANVHRSPKQVFDQVYRKARWGEAGDEFFSGPGSAGPEATSYASCIRGFIEQYRVGSIVDLGCGDFRVARMIVNDEIDYLGIDVVNDLVAHNRTAFGSDRIGFECLDITADQLPGGDLCLMREVLQHLSNAEISRVLAKLTQYRYIIYSDYQPPMSRRFAPNRDIVHGHDTRIWKDSCVCLDRPPFDMHVTLLLDVPSTQELRSPGERIRTYLVEPRRKQAGG